MLKATCVAIAALKINDQCSFTLCKLRLIANFCLAMAASLTLSKCRSPMSKFTEALLVLKVREQAIIEQLGEQGYRYYPSGIYMSAVFTCRKEARYG